MVNKLHQLSTVVGTLLLLLSGNTVGLGDIIYAVNCGGDAHTDVFGVTYEKDANKVRRNEKAFFVCVYRAI